MGALTGIGGGALLERHRIGIGGKERGGGHRTVPPRTRYELDYVEAALDNGQV